MVHEFIFPSSIFLIIVVGIYLYLSKKDELKATQAAVYVYKNVFDILLIILSISGIIGLVLLFIPAGTFSGAFSSYPRLILTAIAGTILGSVTAGPPILSYPIAKAMLQEGIMFGVIAAFISAWGLLDPLSMPAEIHYLGKKFAFWRAAFSFALAVTAGLAVFLLV